MHYRPKEPINKTKFFTFISFIFAGILISKLFQLQVLAHDHYQEIASKEQYGVVELSAQRGEILLKDFHSQEEFRIATNTTFNLVFADPTLIKDPQYVSEVLTPLLFDLEEERQIENVRIEKLAATVAAETPEEELKKLLTPYTDDELKANYKNNLIKILGQKQRPEILLVTKISNETVNRIQQLQLSGIEVKNNSVYAYPEQIIDKKTTATTLEPLIQIPSPKLEKILQGENRYVVLKRKVHPDIADKIKEYTSNDPKKFFTGIGMKEEYYRFYPEKGLAANVIGYIDKNNDGQYGIESTFNQILKGVNGSFQAKRDANNRQITVGESLITPAIDGSDVVLTIDRSIQMKAEQLLAKHTQDFRADSGQIIIMNPQTGAIIAMAHFPSFDPNDYGNAFARTEIFLSPEEIENLKPTQEENTFEFIVNAASFEKYKVFKQTDAEGKARYYRYTNFVGPEVYHNKIVGWPYEPGSVFKSVVMAIGLEEGEVTPNTTYLDNGPVCVDFNVISNKYDFCIDNSTGSHGLVDMRTVLADSLNTGMNFVINKIGAPLVYNYFEKFGFTTKTDIEFDSEKTGILKHFDKWTESELATKSFGQGMTINMVQMANAYSVIANGGVLMQPHIIAEIRDPKGKKTVTEPNRIRQILSPETSATMTDMLINVIETGYSGKAKAADHYLAGKSGTSQTYKNGKALSGSGTTIATFAGYGPVSNPQFVILVKYDRPRSSVWGSDTAAITFREIAEYMFNYYNIPPDRHPTE